MGKEKPQLPEEHVSGQANKPLSRPAHALSHQAVADEIQANIDDGLSNSEAESRLKEYGPNEFGDTGGVQPVKILLRQVANAMTLVIPSSSGRFGSRYLQPRLTYLLSRS